jgi:type VI secretion system protein ImpA
MSLRDNILDPIPGENPSGADLRYAPLYDKIKEARREDDELAQGAWQHERKIADHNLAVRLAEEAIATTTKDLQLAVWLTESLLKTRGFGGLQDGLGLCNGLLVNFWDTLYPELDEGDAEYRAAPLIWLGSRVDVTVKKTPLCRDGYNFLQYKDSRVVGYEDQAKSKEQKAARDAALKEGKIAPEIFDKSFGETPKVFYAQAEKELSACLHALSSLNELCDEKFGEAAPSFGRLKSALEDVRHVVHGLLQKKREFEPDPVEEVPPAPPESTSSEPLPPGAPISPGTGGVPQSVHLSYAAAEPADRAAAMGAIASAATFLRKRDVRNPAPYLMLRGLRWGELRGARDQTALEAPPTEVRRHIKALALNNRWREVLETGEEIMAQPYGRAWLDLQRFSVEACAALGDDFNAIAIGIRSELRALLNDLPLLLDATLADDTPAANPTTQAWLRELRAEPASAPTSPNPAAVPVFDGAQDPGWKKQFIDPYTLAKEAMRQGQPQRAFELLHNEVDRQRSGRGRFQRKLQLAQLCIGAGKDAIAQPLLDDLAAAVETHKLEEWEDRELVAGVLVLLMQSSKKIQADTKLKQAMFDRVCRLDPVQAFSV